MEHQVSNPVVVTGDRHSTFVDDIKRDFDDPSSPVVASEFVGTSISSNGDAEVYGPMIKFNPHITFFDGDRRGYLHCKLDRSQLRTCRWSPRSAPRTPPSRPSPPSWSSTADRGHTRLH